METVVSCCEKLREVGHRLQLVPLRNAANALEGLLLDSPNQYRSIVQQALSELRVFEGPRVLRALSGSDWHPQDLKSDPTTVYITLPDQELEMWGPLLRVLIAEHFRCLQEKLDQENLPVTFFLDECAVLGNFPELQRAIAQGAGYGIRPWMFFQDIGQIKEVYDNPQSILGNVAARTYMNPQSETARMLSEELGIQRNVMTGKETPLARPEALSGPEFSDQVIILVQGHYPVRGDKLFAYRIPVFQEQLGSPPILEYPV